MSEENPHQYFIHHDVLSLIWIALHESGNTELAQTVADAMQNQGCQELSGTEDMGLVAMFWKYLLERRGISKLTKEGVH